MRFQLFLPKQGPRHTFIRTELLCEVFQLPRAVILGLSALRAHKHRGNIMISEAKERELRKNLAARAQAGGRTNLLRTLGRGL